MKRVARKTLLDPICFQDIQYYSWDNEGPLLLPDYGMFVHIGSFCHKATYLPSSRIPGYIRWLLIWAKPQAFMDFELI